MKKITTLKTLIVLGFFPISFSSASAFSFKLNSLNENVPAVERFVGILFQSNTKIGAALIGEVTSISTTTNIFTLDSKQKQYLLTFSPETKVRKLGFPSTINEVKLGDKVSVVSSVSKVDTIKLKAKVISILSQENEVKYIKASSTEEIASSTELLLPVLENMATSTQTQSDTKDIKEKEGKEKEEKKIIQISASTVKK